MAGKKRKGVTGIMRRPLLNIKRYMIKFQDNRFMYFSRWLFFGLLIGIVAGVGAIIFNALIRLFRFIFQNTLEGYYSPRPELMGQTGAPPHVVLVHWLFLLIPAVGGLFSGILVYTFAPEAEGHGTDAAIDAFHNKEGFIRGRVPIIKTEKYRAIIRKRDVLVVINNAENIFKNS